MRAFLRHLAWGLATAALMMVTPLRAAAVHRTATGATALAGATPASTLAVEAHTGGGWDELYCAACVGVGTFALYSGGITMLPVILANPQTVSTLAGSCLLACRSALDDLM